MGFLAIVDQSTKISEMKSLLALPELLVRLSLLYPFVLCAPVLEPNLDLRLAKLEPLCQFAAARSADVLRATVLHLQQCGLLLAEGCPLPPCPRVLSCAACQEGREATGEGKSSVE